VKPLKKIGKVIGQSEGIRRFACFLLACYITLLFRTGRWTILNDAQAKRYWEDGQAFILCFWHGRLLMMPYSWRRRCQIHMLISAHRDGKLIANTVAHFGIKTAEGSSTRGGAAALRVMVKALKQGEWVGITPDGPSGPRMRVGGGAIDIARIAQVPILPASFGIEKGKVLKSWDRFLLGFPFSKGVFIWGDPIVLAKDANPEAREQARQQLETALNKITAEADRLTGRVPVEPALGDEGRSKSALKEERDRHKK